jgi:hypothetical protein
MSSSSVVVNELLDAHKKLDEACDNIKRAMAYVDDDAHHELERIRKRIIDIKLEIDYVIDKVMVNE